ncbi:MAG: hypothetical protein QS748_08355 [Candidatus Endonucleobacter bathymodioli]|uniref:Uncharacterized protein n=1 Tax=Candidatus Endonucleibacter bathymodioli TaxID=539814 RepID=A0AA90NRF5_9GAMM|nr:hypothetical protein [Candidatus Endonucleobacter bathymodioli]
MATNGKSAEQWLKKNHKDLSVERIQLIMSSINKKTDTLQPDHPEYEGLIEAFDIMEQCLVTLTKQGLAISEKPEDMLNYGQLTPNIDTKEYLNPTEKARRFSELLKKSDL